MTTLCPCSKELSEKGAHNQRGLVTVQVKFRKFFWIEDLIRMIEHSASAAVFSLLKRSDEKFVTEKAYENPMFVEDVVRNVALRLGKHANITWFSVESENLESIHNHNAYAYVEKERQAQRFGDGGSAIPPARLPATRAFSGSLSGDDLGLRLSVWGAV